MSSVNSSQQDPSTVKVSNLYKKLGIANNQALRPPLPKEQVNASKKTPRRQTVFLPRYPEVLKNLQRCNTIRPEGHRSSSNLHRQEPVNLEPFKPQRNLTPKSRFISNWNQRKEKENGNDTE